MGRVKRGSRYKPSNSCPYMIGLRGNVNELSKKAEAQMWCLSRLKSIATNADAWKIEHRVSSTPGVPRLTRVEIVKTFGLITSPHTLPLACAQALPFPRKSLGPCLASPQEVWPRQLLALASSRVRVAQARPSK